MFASFKKKLKYAEEVVYKGLILFPDNSTLHLAAAVVAFKQGDWEQTIYHYEKVERLNKQLKPPELDRYASALTELKQYNQAEETIHEGLIHYQSDKRLLERLIFIAATKLDWEAVVIRGEQLLTEIGDKQDATKACQATMATAAMMLDQKKEAESWSHGVGERVFHKPLWLSETILMYKTNHRTSTLVIVEEKNGVYKGAVKTSISSLKKEPVDILTVKINLNEEVDELERIASHYARVIIIGFEQVNESTSYILKNLNGEALIFNPKYDETLVKMFANHSALTILFDSIIDNQDWDSLKQSMSVDGNRYPFRLKALGEKKDSISDRLFATYLRHFVTHSHALSFMEVHRMHLCALANECENRGKERWSKLLVQKAQFSPMSAVSKEVEYARE